MPVTEGRGVWRNWALSLWLVLAAIALHAQVAEDVDPFLGIEGGGNTIPGPSLPFGMIKPGPDVGANQSNSGWEPTGKINGFSQTHVSGTGGGPKYGNILVQATIGAPRASGYGSVRDSEQGTIGYYRVRLQRYGIDTEITTSQRAAIYRFTYPASEKANLLIDAGHCLSWISKAGEGQFVTSSATQVVSDSAVSGSSTVTGGWNKQTTPYTVYFYAVSDTPARDWGTWKNGTLHRGSKLSAGEKSGAWLSFATRQGQQIRLKIGISFVSIAQAKRSVEQEIPDFDFDRVHRDAVVLWNRALGVIDLRGSTHEQQQMFYTAMYHTMLMPVDRSGENPLWQSNEPSYDDFYAIWDTFRSSGPLLTLIAPNRESDIVRALVDIYRHEHWLPDARSGNFTGRTQGGSNAEFAIADAYVKNLPGIDWQDAYRGMLQDAETPSPEPQKEGRSGLNDWKSLGYVAIEGSGRPGSKQMEYAADDFEIALVAKGLGKDADYEKYLRRSENWKNLWNPSVSDDGVHGFIEPRHRDGTWKKDFTTLESCSWGGDSFYECNSWTYSLFVPQNVAGVIELSGGREQFVRRLDAFFDGKGRYDVGNEPGFLSPYLYIWAGRQDKTSERVQEIIGKNFHTGRRGIPGNDDSGAMSSWYVFSAMGIFPNAGQDVYLIGHPTFPEVTLNLAQGKTFTIEANNLSPANSYVVAASLNGKPLERAWFRHEDLMVGGRLVLTMAHKPAIWPSGDPPPSLSPR
jgi:predicted alpha-1,2-mannosidase